MNTQKIEMVEVEDVMCALEVQKDRLEAFADLMENTDFTLFMDMNEDDNEGARLRSGLAEILRLWLDREGELIEKIAHTKQAPPANSIYEDNLSWEKVRQIRDEYGSGNGINQMMLARKFKVPQPIINLVIRGLIWKPKTDPDRHGLSTGRAA